MKNRSLTGSDITWAIQETLEILTDTDAVRDLKQGIEEARRGQTVSWEEARLALTKSRKK